jgi:hypothetical protein
VLCEDAFPDIGKPNYGIISMTRKLIDKGHEVVLWTCRTAGELDKAVAWCNDRGLHFAAINENAPSNIEKFKSKYPEGTRKVYADVYIDDHNLHTVVGRSGLSGAMAKLINNMD